MTEKMDRKEVMTSTGVGRLLGFAPSTVRKFAREGRIRHFLLPPRRKALRFLRKDVLEFAAEHNIPLNKE